jgi:hypothetical protein
MNRGGSSIMLFENFSDVHFADRSSVYELIPQRTSLLKILFDLSAKRSDRAHVPPPPPPLPHPPLPDMKLARKFSRVAVRNGSAISGR